MRINKLLIILTLLLVVNVTQARLLDLNEENINNTIITHNGKEYRILSDMIFSVDYLGNGVSSFRRIIIEDLTTIEQITEQINELETMIMKTEERIDEINQIKENDLAVLYILEKQRDRYKKQVEEMREVKDELEGMKNELENKITGNILVSPTSYRIGIVIIIFMLVLVLIGKGAELFKEEKPKKKGEL